jgi:sugar lactone lactonase YvrE
MISAGGTVTTLAGSAGTTGSADGAGAAAQFNAPQAVAVDGSGTIYVADSGNSTIREITPAGVVSTIAGSPGTSGSSDGIGAAALFNSPQGIAVDATGNVYVADTGNSTIRMITPTGVVTTLAGTAGATGGTDGTGSAAQFNGPRGLVVDASGNIYVADANNYTVRQITAAGVVTTLAGKAGYAGFADGVGSTARLDLPSGIALDAGGNVYVTDRSLRRIRMITPAGVVSTVAGYPGDRGVTLGPLPGTLNDPAGVAVLPGPTVRLAVADNAENAILSIALP